MEEDNRISSYLMTLDKYGKYGKIHSVFEHSFNILVNGRLINVMEQSDILSSFGLVLSKRKYQRLVKYLRQDNLVKLLSDELIFYSFRGTYRIKMNLSVTDVMLPALKLSPEKLREIWGDLLNLELKSQLGLSIGQKEESIFEDLISPKVTDKTVSVLSLIGRGKGLTPSGDDLLLGYLFIQKLYQQDVTNLERVLLDNLSRTTSISQAYIKSLTDGAVSTAFVDLARIIQNKSEKKDLKRQLNIISEIGNTSGKDMLFGMCLGIKYLEKVEIK